MVFKLLMEGSVGCGVGKIARDKRQGGGKFLPRFFGVIPGLAEAIRAIFQPQAEFIRASILDIEPNHGEMFGQPLVQLQAVEGRRKLAPGQIAHTPENNQDRWFCLNNHDDFDFKYVISFPASMENAFGIHTLASVSAKGIQATSCVPEPGLCVSNVLQPCTSEIEPTLVMWALIESDHRNEV
jgi:hypothetical protein